MAELVAAGMPAPQRVRQAQAPDADEDPEEQDDTEEPDLWPCNVQAVEVFAAMQTQWRVGFAGRTGLDYGVLPQVMGWVGLSAEEQPLVWADVQVMEIAALGVWAEQAQRDKDRQERMPLPGNSR